MEKLYRKFRREMLALVEDEYPEAGLTIPPLHRYLAKEFAFLRLADSVPFGAVNMGFRREANGKYSACVRVAICSTRPSADRSFQLGTSLQGRAFLHEAPFGEASPAEYVTGFDDLTSAHSHAKTMVSQHVAHGTLVLIAHGKTATLNG